MDVQPLVDALSHHSYAMFAALLVGLLVDFAKQGWFSSWLARRLKPAWLPWVAIGLGVAGTVSTSFVSGKPIVAALMEGLAAGMAAIAGHEMLIEGLRGGRELTPDAPWHRDPDPPKPVDPPVLHH